MSIKLFDMFLKLNKYTVTSLDILCLENSRNCCVKSKTNFGLGEKSFILLKIKDIKYLI